MRNLELIVAMQVKLSTRLSAFGQTEAIVEKPVEPDNVTARNNTIRKKRSKPALLIREYI